MAHPTHKADSTNVDEESLDNSETITDNRRKEKQLSPREEALARITESYETATLGEPFTESDDTAADVEAETPAKAVPPVEDVLKDFIVMDKGVALFKTKIDGQEKLIPLDKARQSLQKHESADVRLQQATQMAREVQTRIEALKQQEAALNARVQSSPPSQDADDQVGLEDARKLVEVLISGTKDEAATELAKVLNVKRQAPKALVVNEDAIVDKAAHRVKAELSENEKQADAAAGYLEAQKQYPEVFADVGLYQYADALSEKIAEENPTLPISQVILKATQQTREWVQSLRGPAQTPSAPTVKNDRLARKQNLVPIPTPRIQKQELTNEVESPETPNQILAEIRKARGQAL